MCGPASTPPTPAPTGAPPSSEFVARHPAGRRHPSAAALDAIAAGLERAGRRPGAAAVGPARPGVLRPVPARPDRATAAGGRPSLRGLQPLRSRGRPDVRRGRRHLGAAPQPGRATPEPAVAVGCREPARPVPDSGGRCGPASASAPRPRHGRRPGRHRDGPEGGHRGHRASPSWTPGSRTWPPACAACGVGRGDRIALLVPPGADLTAVLYGIWRAGAIAVVVDAGLGLRGMRTALRSAGPKYVVGDGQGPGCGAADGPGAQPICVGPVPASAAAARCGVRWPWTSSRPVGRASALPEPPAADDQAAVAFTSGATGPAKGVRVPAPAAAGPARRARDASTRSPPADRLVAAFGPFALFGAALGIASAVPDMDLTAPSTLTARAMAEPRRAIGATLVFASPAALANVVGTAGDAGRAPAAGPWPACGCCCPPARPCPAETLHDDAAPDAEGRGARPLRHDRGAAGRRHRPGRHGRAPARATASASGGRCPGWRSSVGPLGHDGRSAGRPPDDRPGVTGEVCVRAAHVKERYDRLWVTEQAPAPGTPAGTAPATSGTSTPTGRLWIEGRLVHVVVTADGPVTPVGIERRVEAVPGCAAPRRWASGRAGGPAGRRRGAAGCRRPGLAAPARCGRPCAPRRRGLAGPRCGPRDRGRARVRRLPVDIRHNSKIDRARLAAGRSACWPAGRVRRPVRVLVTGASGLLGAGVAAPLHDAR